jgi:hypothetical protein
LWSAINRFNPKSDNTYILHELVSLAFVLEERLQLAYHQSSLLSYPIDSSHIPSVIGQLIQFYSQPEINSRSISFTDQSLTLQLFDKSRFHRKEPSSCNPFDPLAEADSQDDTMEIDLSPDTSASPSSTPVSLKKTVTWSTDSGIADLSANLFTHLKDTQDKAADNGELEPDHVGYKPPQDSICSTVTVSQRIRFNLIRHHGVSCDIPTIKLFKSFTSTLKRVDPSLIILPFQSSKQHYSSLPTLKHIQTMEANKLNQFFHSYHPRQFYSISGYFHISSELSFDILMNLPEVEEWLDSHKYFAKVCPSQSKEMVKIGVLCYGSTLIFREDLKQAILAHPSWTPTDPNNPPIFDIFVGELNSTSKKTKMLFVSAERSKQEEVSSLFKAIYDGTKKNIPKRIGNDFHSHCRYS